MFLRWSKIESNSVLPGGFPTTIVSPLNLAECWLHSPKPVGRLSEVGLAGDERQSTLVGASRPRLGGPHVCDPGLLRAWHPAASVPARCHLLTAPRYPGFMQISVHLLRVLFSSLNWTMTSSGGFGSFWKWMIVHHPVPHCFKLDWSKNLCEHITQIFICTNLD